MNKLTQILRLIPQKHDKSQYQGIKKWLRHFLIPISVFVFLKVLCFSNAKLGRICLTVIFFVFLDLRPIAAKDQSMVMQKNPSVQTTPRGILFEQHFRDQTLRIDLFHTWDGKNEVYTLDELIKEPKWAGTRRNLIDPFGYGNYRAEVLDKKTGQLLFSVGFDSLFGEWKTTDEAKKRGKTYHESVLVPYPHRPAKFVISLRQKDGRRFQKIFETQIDPRSYQIRPAPKKGPFEIVKLHISGGYQDRADIVILPEGYTLAQEKKMIRDLVRFTRVFLNTPPFSQFRDKINIRAVKAFSRESGTSEPRKGIYKETILGTHFNTFELPRYLMTSQNKRLRDIAGQVPYDSVFIMVNTARYGGGAIYNQYAVFVSDNLYDEYIMVHEFGHSFGGLADEYYTSQVAYSDFYVKGVEPWEPNITAFLSREQIKWIRWVDKGIPLPTPPDQKRYGKVTGCFEGAGYSAKGLFRPSFTCKMFGKGNVPFCKICQRALTRMIQYYSE